MTLKMTRKHRLKLAYQLPSLCVPELFSKIGKQLIPGSDRVPPKFVEPTLGGAGKSGWEQHTPKLGIHVAGPHHDIKRAEVTHRVGGPIICGKMGYLKPWWKWDACDARSKWFKLLI